MGTNGKRQKILFFFQIYVVVFTNMVNASKLVIWKLDARLNARATYCRPCEWKQMVIAMKVVLTDGMNNGNGCTILLNSNTECQTSCCLSLKV